MSYGVHQAPIVLPLISKVLSQKLNPHKGRSQARNYLPQNQHPALEHSQWRMFTQGLVLEPLLQEPASMLWVKILVIAEAQVLMHCYLSYFLVLELFYRLVYSQAQVQAILPELSLLLAIKFASLAQVEASLPLILISPRVHSEQSMVLVLETLFLMQALAIPLPIAWGQVLQQPIKVIE